MSDQIAMSVVAQRKSGFLKSITKAMRTTTATLAL
jgi:hypothetical protein